MSSKAGIIQICSSLPPTPDGVGDACYRLHEIFCKGKNESWIITSQSEKYRENTLCRVKKWTIWGLPYGELKKLKDTCKTIILHYPTIYYGRHISFVLIPKVLRLLGFRVCVFLHEYRDYSILGKIRIHLLLLFANKIISADSVNYEVLRVYPLYNRKITLFPGIPTIVKSDLDSNCEVNKIHGNDKIRLLYFGFLREGKEIIPFLELYRNDTILKTMFVLVVIGLVQFKSKAIESDIKNLLSGMDGIEYYDYLPVDQVQRHYENCDVVLLPYSEGVTERRSSFLTSMSFGKLVLTVEPPRKFEELQNGYNVWYAKNASPTEFQKQLLHIATLNNSERNVIGHNARNWFMKFYTDEVLSDKMIKIIKT